MLHLQDTTYTLPTDQTIHNRIRSKVCCNVFTYRIRNMHTNQPFSISILFYFILFLGALIITGGLTLHLCVAAMLIFKPIKRKDQVPTNENTLKNGISVSKGKIKYSQHESKHLSTFQQMKTLTQQQNYIFIFLNMFLIYAGFYLACTHIVAYAEYHGASSFTAGVMASTLGFCNLAGRLGLSLLSQHPEINTIYLHSISTLILGNIYLRSLNGPRPLGLRPKVRQKWYPIPKTRYYSSPFGIYENSPYVIGQASE